MRKCVNQAEAEAKAKKERRIVQLFNCYIARIVKLLELLNC